MTEIRCSIELRAAGDGETTPGRLIGVLLTEGVKASDRPELFLPGSLIWPADGVVLRRQHVREAPIARVVPERRGAEIVIDTALPDSIAGRDAATEIKAGILRGLSVEFKATASAFRGGLREIRHATLTGAGLVDHGSYRDSVVSVRHARVGGRRRVWL